MGHAASSDRGQRQGAAAGSGSHAMVTGRRWPAGANMGPVIAPTERPMSAPNTPIVAHDCAVPTAISPHV